MTRNLHNRRQFIGASAGLAAAAIVATRTNAQDSTPASPAAGGEWIFTDDKGVTVTLPEMPQRIVADVNAAAHSGYENAPGCGVRLERGSVGEPDQAGGNVDPAAVQVAGNTTSNNPEKVVVADPDLLVTITWTPDDPTEYWSIDPKSCPQVLPIAPLVAISATGMADVNTERFAELAVLLGADLSSPELAEAKATYEAALADFPHRLR